MRRITVIGTTGSGKTTVARRLAELLGISHIELDALHWEPEWQAAPADVLRARVTAAVAGEAWVTDGNYALVRDLVWSRADTLVWLDYRLPRVLWQVTARTARRIVTGEPLWSGNRERLRMALSRDSILLWALRTYRLRRRDFPVLLRAPGAAHLRCFRFRTPRRTRAWLAEVEASP